jgi:imidazoleglycerol-phosphate dehydratase
MSRTATVNRKTNETDITCTLELDGSGTADVQTGVGFLDHLLTSLAKHARFDLTLTCKGDTHIDDHHTAEDCALTLGLRPWTRRWRRPWWICPAAPTAWLISN